MQKPGNQLISDASSVTPWPRRIYRDADSFWNDSKGLHYAYIVFRTLRGDYKRVFHPDAVFYVGRSPAAYLKTVKTNNISDADIRDWQRFLWNQAVVPMLIVQSRTEIRVYTAYTKPDKRESTERIKSILETTSDALKLDRLWTIIESGDIYQVKPEAFQRSNAVDRHLLRNLNAAAYQLAGTQPEGVTQKNLEFTHLFLIRLLFVCYLIERGMVKGKDFEAGVLQKLRQASEEADGYFLRHLFDDLKTYSERRDALCGLFAHVRERFNGSLFPETITKEKARYNKEFINKLDLFLHAHNLQDSQLMLSFWAYDFSVIPIETISAVYEDFLGAEGKIKESSGNGNSQRGSGAYYTPLHLAELTVDIALENVEKPVHEIEVLDPACGSGVFLVSLFGRIAESLRRAENHTIEGNNIGWARKLLPKLHQLYGIDINSTACHITCFSLYLALLEQLEPMHLEYLLKHSEKLPPLLAGDSGSWDTIHHGNLFDPQLSLAKHDFDLVIGNPPWVSRRYQKDNFFLEWRKQNPDIHAPAKQIAHAFMWKAPEYLDLSGIACLLLPATVLLNKTTDKFQTEWLKAVSVERVVNLSDLRFILFPGADHPCLAIRFGRSPPDLSQNIRYECPKTDLRSKQGGPVYIREEETTELRLKDILDATSNGDAPLVWKTSYWASWRDRRLLMRLLDLPKLSAIAGPPNEGKPWMKGQGIQVTGDLNPGWWHPSIPYIDSDLKCDLAIPLQALPTAEQAGIPQKVHRPREECLFKGPKVLLSKASRKIIFCSNTILFRDTFTTITGREECDQDNLRFLAAVLGSDLAYYFLIHTNANIGIYRPLVYPDEFLSIPFFLPRDAPDRVAAERIVNETARALTTFEECMQGHTWFEQQNDSVRIRREVEPLVRQYYEIDRYEAMLIDDTLQLAAKSFHPRGSSMDVPTLRTPAPEHTKVYAQTLCEMLNNFGKGSKFRVKSRVILGQPYSVVHVSLTSKAVASVPVSQAPGELEETFKRMESLLDNKQGQFVFCRNLKVFDGNDLYLLKPMQMRFWSRTAALNDADEIAGAIIKFRGR